MKLTANKIDPKLLNEILAKKISWLIHFSEPLRIILFGSAASGEMTDASDIDLIVIYKDGVNLKEIQKKLFLNRPQDDWPHDLLFYTELSFKESLQKGGGVCWIAEQEGKVIYHQGTTNVSK